MRGGPHAPSTGNSCGSVRCVPNQRGPGPGNERSTADTSAHLCGCQPPRLRRSIGRVEDLRELRPEVWRGRHIHGRLSKAVAVRCVSGIRGRWLHAGPFRRHWGELQPHVSGRRGRLLRHGSRSRVLQRAGDRHRHHGNGALVWNRPSTFRWRSCPFARTAWNSE